MQSEDSNRSTQRNNKASRPRQYKCGACNEEGHNARNCRRRLEQQGNGFHTADTSSGGGGSGSGAGGGGGSLLGGGVRDRELGLEKADMDLMNPPKGGHQVPHIPPHFLDLPTHMKPLDQQINSSMGPPMLGLPTVISPEQSPDHNAHQQPHSHFPQQHLSAQAHQPLGLGHIITHNSPAQLDGAIPSFDPPSHGFEPNGHHRFQSSDGFLNGLDRAVKVAENVVLRSSLKVASAQTVNDYEKTTANLLNAMENMEKVATVAKRFQQVCQDLECSDWSGISSGK